MTSCGARGSAFITAPLGGQGMNAGIGDATTLDAVRLPRSMRGLEQEPAGPGLRKR